MTTFNAIDVETANADRSSICQIGIISVRNGTVTAKWSSDVNPEDWFDTMNVAIHGIDEGRVQNSPKMPEISEVLREILDNSVVVSHSPFDRTAINRSLERYNLKPLAVRWVDGIRIARLAWHTEIGGAGYGLMDLAERRGIPLNHHDALEDARATAEIVLQACHDINKSFDEILKLVEPGRAHSSRSPSSSLKLQGNAEGPLYGETIVFTGALRMPRQEAAAKAAAAGCNVANTVSKKVTMLIVGLQDRREQAGYEKSIKHRKAEALIGQGNDIHILTEADFLEMIKL